MNLGRRLVGHCRQVLRVNNGGCRQLLRQSDVKCSSATRQVVVGSFFSLAALGFIINGLQIRKCEQKRLKLPSYIRTLQRRLGPSRRFKTSLTQSQKFSPASGSTIALSHWASTYAQRVNFDGHIACRVEMVLKTNRLRDCVWLVY